MTQLQTYIGTKVIQARPMMGPAGNLYPDKDGYEVIYPDGYTSWSPKEAFEQAYRLTDRMTFGDALVMLKAGKRVARAEWADEFGSVISLEEGALVERDLNTGAAASFTAEDVDMLAEDWRVVE